MTRYIKYLFAISVFGLMISTVSAYQQQGFTSYQEGYGDKIDFTCENQCVVLLGDLGSMDYLYLNGQIEGNGTIGYGFLMGEQLAPGHALNINGLGSIDQKFRFSDLPFYSQIPKNAQVTLIVKGNMQGSQLLVQPRYLTFFEKIDQGWKDFWKMEPMTPYSINLRYGVKINGISLVKIGYIIAIMALIGILAFPKYTKKKKQNLMLYRVLAIFLFIGLRNMVTYRSIIENGIRDYSNQASDQKSFYDLGDYITFTDKIRKQLDLDTGKKDCKIYAESFQDRPFRAHRDSLYLKPCQLTLTGDEADYVLFYKKAPGSGYEGKSVLIDFQGSYLLDNK